MSLSFELQSTNKTSLSREREAPELLKRVGELFQAIGILVSLDGFCGFSYM